MQHFWYRFFPVADGNVRKKVDGNRMLKVSKHDKQRVKNAIKMTTVREVCGWKCPPKVDGNRMLKLPQHDKERLKNVTKSVSSPSKSLKIVRKLKNRCKIIITIPQRDKERSKT